MRDTDQEQVKNSLRQKVDGNSENGEEEMLTKATSRIQSHAFELDCHHSLA